jgi:hypothetical protein
MSTLNFNNIKIGDIYGSRPPTRGELKIPEVFFIVLNKFQEEDEYRVQIQWLHETSRKHTFGFSDFFFELYSKVDTWIE